MCICTGHTARTGSIENPIDIKLTAKRGVESRAECCTLVKSRFWHGHCQCGEGYGDELELHFCGRNDSMKVIWLKRKMFELMVRNLVDVESMKSSCCNIQEQYISTGCAANLLGLQIFDPSYDRYRLTFAILAVSLPEPAPPTFEG